MIQIKSIGGKVLYTAEHASDVREALGEAVGARADLAGANLARADLARAYLADAKGFQPERVNDLLLLFDQPGPIRAYKLVNADGEGIYARSNGYQPIRYEVGGTYEVPDANTDPLVACAAGISLATLPWCLKEWHPGCRVLLCEFTAADIAAIPVSDGKFRVRRCTVVGDKDLAGLGLGEKQAATEGG